jgi:hypothetical protein
MLARAEGQCRDEPDACGLGREVVRLPFISRGNHPEARGQLHGPKAGSKKALQLLGRYGSGFYVKGFVKA